MQPTKIGQIVKFHTPFPDEEPNQLYVIFEIHFDVEKPRALIKELNGGKPFASSTVVNVEDLEVSKVPTSDLLGYKVTIEKPDYAQITGKVTKVTEQNIELDLTKSVKGVETNVWLTIQDEMGTAQTGTLLLPEILLNAN